MADFDTFAILLMNDEESIETFELPAELDPVLSNQSFRKVCFIYVVRTEYEIARERISHKHCRGKPSTNFVVIGDNLFGIPR